MRIAVTGASGLIGANVVRAALAAGHEVVALARDGSDCGELEALGVPVARADILGPIDFLAGALAGADVLIHTAATFSYSASASALHKIAVQGTRAVLQAAAAVGIRRAVITSSSVVFGYSHRPEARSEAVRMSDPAGEPAYVAAKIAQDRAALELGETLNVEVVLACPTMTIGPTAAVLGPSNAVILAYLADATRSTYPGGCNIVSAADVGAAHLLLAQHGAAGRHYLLGAENLRWSQIHRCIGRLTGVGGPGVEIGAGFATLAAGAEELAAKLAGREPLSTREQASMLGRFYWYDDSGARALGYAPRSAAEALLETVSWLVASRHVSRELRATIRLADEVHRWRHERVAA
ncbi:MAG: NAD-dependent epimerase/dehydratase family protein [Novosphingobium sp.]